MRYDELMKFLFLFILLALTTHARNDVCELMQDQILVSYLEQRDDIIANLKNHYGTANEEFNNLLKSEDLLDDYFFAFYEEKFNKSLNINKPELWKKQFQDYLLPIYASLGYSNNSTSTDISEPLDISETLLQGVAINPSTFFKKSLFTKELLENISKMFNKSEMEKLEFLAVTFKNAGKFVVSENGSNGIKVLNKSGDAYGYEASHEIKYMGQFGYYRIVGNVVGENIVFTHIIKKSKSY